MKEVEQSRGRNLAKLEVPGEVVVPHSYPNLRQRAGLLCPFAVIHCSRPTPEG